MIIKTPTASQKMERSRANATMPKDNFILAALDAGVLSEADAEEAATGWPRSWNGLFIGRAARDRVEVKARWTNATTVSRTNPVIEALAKASGVSDAAIDALFRIEVGL